MRLALLRGLLQQREDLARIDRAAFEAAARRDERRLGREALPMRQAHARGNPRRVAFGMDRGQRVALLEGLGHVVGDLGIVGTRHRALDEAAPIVRLAVVPRDKRRRRAAPSLAVRLGGPCARRGIRHRRGQATRD